MNKRQHKKNTRKQTMPLSRSEMARQYMPENHKRRLQCLNYTIQSYSNKINNWSDRVVYKHFNYTDYVRECTIDRIIDSHPVPELWRMK